MPSWWKRSKSAFHRSSVTPSSAPGSPARASTSRVQPGGRRGAADEGGGEGDFLAVVPPKLTRQRKLRHVDGIDVDCLGDLNAAAAAEPGRRASSSPPLQRGRAAAEAVGIPGSIPISWSASSREAVVQPPRSASSPVLHPLPLPSPRPPDLEPQDPPGVADGWGLSERTPYAPRY
nr:unnamed protein product [Digitaria exilis]